jgi:hypothetical protein
MPLDPLSVTAVMEPSMVGVGMLGSGHFSLVSGLSNALSRYSTQAVSVSVGVAGTAGVGSVFGFGIVIPPGAFLGILFASLQANGINGMSSLQLATGISSGFTLAYAQAIVTATSPTVGAGAGVASLAPNPSVSTDIFYSEFIGAGMTGSAVRPLARAVSGGLDSILASCFGPVVVVGPPSIAPSAGIGSGRLT